MAYYRRNIPIENISEGDIISIDIGISNALGPNAVSLLAKVLRVKRQTGLVEIIFLNEIHNSCIWFSIRDCYYLANNQGE